MLPSCGAISRAAPSPSSSRTSGSTRLLHELGAEAYAKALAEHRRVIRNACAEQGVEVDTQGDAFFFAFPTAPGAVHAASELTDALASGPTQVRVGLHTGTPLLTREGYVGSTSPRGADRRRRKWRAGASSPPRLPPPSISSSTTSASIASRTSPHRSAFSSCGGAFPMLRSLYRTNLPVPRRPSSESARALGGRRARNSRRRSPSDPHRPGWDRPDAWPSRRRPKLLTVIAKVCGGYRSLPCATRRSSWKRRHGFSAPRRILPRTSRTIAHARPLRQLRTGGGCGAGRRRNSWPRAHTSTSSSRAGALTSSRRADILGSASRAGRRWRCSRLAPAPSMPRSTKAEAVGSSACGSASCRSRSGSPPPVPRSSPEQLLARLSQRLDLLKGSATPTRDSRHCGRRSSGRTTC